MLCLRLRLHIFARDDPVSLFKDTLSRPCTLFIWRKYRNLLHNPTLLFGEDILSAIFISSSMKILVFIFNTRSSLLLKLRKDHLDTSPGETAYGSGPAFVKLYVHP